MPQFDFVNFLYFTINFQIIYVTLYYFFSIVVIPYFLNRIYFKNLRKKINLNFKNLNLLIVNNLNNNNLLLFKYLKYIVNFLNCKYIYIFTIFISYINKFLK